MRAVRITLAGFGLAVVAAGVSGAVLGLTRSAAFAREEKALETRWQRVAQEGVAAAQLAPLRSRLAASPFLGANWASPVWWTGTGQSLIDSLGAGTEATWNRDVEAARARADEPIVQWRQLQAQLGPYLPAADAAAARRWPAQLAAATSPLQLLRYASSWEETLASARHTALRAELDAQVAQLGGLQGVLAQARQDETTAQNLNLDDEGIGSLAASLRSEMAADQDATGTLGRLVSAMAAFHQLLALNDNVAGTLRPIELAVDQAVAEGTPDAQPLLGQYNGAQSALTAAREPSQLTAVAQELASLQSSVAGELGNDRCGHAVPAGKVITINLTVQEAVFYQDGCVVQATPVTTGRAELRTPTGNFHVFFKQSPFQFISPWPPSSPFYYYPSWVSWVMEFDTGGYFLHDAPWEPGSQYGPGSEDSSGASHGCIHIPTPVMQWAYQWTPMGTPVIVSY